MRGQGYKLCLFYALTATLINFENIIFFYKFTGLIMAEIYLSIFNQQKFKLMKRLKFLILIVIPIWFWSCSNINIKYPDTKKVDQVDDYFGVKVEDPYRWLENDRSEETEAWVKAQNEVTFNYLAQIPYREKIKNRLQELWNFETMKSPQKIGDKYFFLKNDGLQNQSVLYYKESIDSEPKVLIDPNTLSEDGTVAMDANFSISKDGKYIAYQVSSGGSDWHEIYVRNIETGKDIEDIVQWVKFSEIAWYKDGFFYSRYPESNEGDELSAMNEFHKIYYHNLYEPKSQLGKHSSTSLF